MLGPCVAILGPGLSAVQIDHREPEVEYAATPGPFTRGDRPPIRRPPLPSEMAMERDS